MRGPSQWGMSRRLICHLAALMGLMLWGLAPATDALAQGSDRRTPDGALACDSQDAAWTATVDANAYSYQAMVWAPYGAAEYGWDTYLPLIQQEIGTGCAPQSLEFARALAAFQARYNLAPTGLFDEATFQVFRGVWQERRPFIMARVRNEPCPDPPPLNQLGYLVEAEEHADRLTRLLRRDTLEAYRQMVAAARREVPEIGANPELLQIFSGFRDPEADAARCATEGNCDGQRRAVCSAHRTGAAVDLYVGHLEGLSVDSTRPESRAYMARSPTYMWLVKNAGRFGFVPYAYEPWHWEYVRSPQS